MSRDFIGSKISIITKSQVRYSGTIIGIDSQTSSIVLGNVKSFGTENRATNSANGSVTGVTLPIMQFANSDIEDLKIIDEESSTGASGTAQQQASFSMSKVSSSAGPLSSASIHDDPAIVSAVMSSANKESTSNGSLPNRLLHNIQQLKLSDGQSKKEESRINTNSGESGATWSLLSSSNWEQNNGQGVSQQRSGNKSKFFDDFISDKNNASNDHQLNRGQGRSSNTHSTQTSRENGGGQYDENGFRVRQPFFADDHPYPPQQQQQQRQYQGQSNRYQNGNGYQQQQQQHQQQRYFHNNRRPPMINHARRMGGGGGNRETFQNNPNDYEADFDFETSNLKFNKLTSDDEPKNSNELASPKQLDLQSSSDYPTLYDKKKSFFDNLVLNEPSDGLQGHKFNRSKNTDTFGSDGYQRNNYRSNGYGNSSGGGGGGYRRSNNNNYRERNNNNNNNGYRYRY